MTLHGSVFAMSSMGRWFRESSLVRIVLGFALAAAVLAACGWLVTGPYKASVAGFDSNIRYTMRQIQSPMWTSVLIAASRIGSTWGLSIIGGITALAFILLRWFRPLMLLCIAMAGQAVLHLGFNALFERPRPPALISYKIEESFSFPSGHSIAALCFFGSLAWLVATRYENAAAKAGIAIFATVLIFLIGFSRVYIGVHYPTDVVAGFLGAAVWTAAVMSADRRPL